MPQASDVVLRRIAAGGLCIGAVFGLAGSLVVSPILQASLWAIDGTALVAATSLLAVKYLRAGVDLAAAGFLVFATAEAVILSGTAAGPHGQTPTLAAGTALWAVALLMISAPPTFPTWVRMAGALAAGMFTVTAAKLFGGQVLTPMSAPFPFFAYPILAITLLGWAWTALREAT
ncbi:MAG TPA: hypothetical protein VNH46_14020 [Gemmatimonadales bacterium]|nr:hypothetical protein [Gemmatimonadales bacterium]